MMEKVCNGEHFQRGVFCEPVQGRLRDKWPPDPERHSFESRVNSARVQPFALLLWEQQGMREGRKEEGLKSQV